MNELLQFFTCIESYIDSEGRVLIAQAVDFAQRCHEGFYRLDGSSYILHPIAVANILGEWHAPSEILAAALLHDIFKRRYSRVPSLAVLEAEFPQSLITLVQDVASLGELGPSLIQKRVELYAEELYENTVRSSQRFLWATVLLQHNPMAVVIKLADRLHNLQAHDELPAAARQEGEKWFAAAILNIFAPLAERLGMRQVKEVLEDGAFSLYNFERYTGIDTFLREVLTDVPLGDRVNDLEQILWERGISAKVLGRWKHRYGIFRQQLKSATREVTPADMLYIVVVVPSVEDCYRTLGVVHSTWRFLSEVYDYIAIPRPNGYRALHTRTFEPSLGAIEVIIRTEAMHLVANYGITAQWRGVDKAFLPKIDMLPERPDGHIMVITPKGEVKYLPEGATPIDFAYAIHEEMGHRCMQAWVNGNQVPLEAPLQDGSVVDVIVSRGVAGPSKEWLKHVVTPLAKGAIERWTRRETYVELTVEGTDRVGLLKDVIDCISTKGINILYSLSKVLVNKASFHLVLHVIGPATLDDLEQELNGIPQVTRVQFQVSDSIPQTPLHANVANGTSTLLPVVSGTPTPYALTPVVGRNFKGRDRVVQDIVDRLRGIERDNPLLIWGQQRIGKTSLLWHLEKDILQNETYLIVYVTLHDGLLDQPMGYFLHRIATEIERKVQREELKAPHPHRIKREPVYYFQGFIDHLEQVMGPQNLLIILDEFQGIGTLKEEGATRHDVFTYFRSLLQRRVSVNFIFCGGGVPEHLLRQSGLNSLLSVVDPIKVGRLELEAAKALVTESDASLNYEDRAVKKLLEVTDCHPCYLKYLCRELYVSRTSQKIALKDVERVIDQTMEWGPKLEGLIQHFWEMDLQSQAVAKKHKHVLAAIAGSADSSRWVTIDKLAEHLHPLLLEEELPELLTNLVGYGTIDMSGTTYRIHLPLLDLWFQRICPL
ncbi:MAG TPA: HD domain-containing protein [Ktedonobacteraceae bacterium]|nr:HD domain-containing protein [Ktedonobacteraceae bacterium]